VSRCPPWPLCRFCRLDPPPRSLAADAHDCIMVESQDSPHTRLWGQVRPTDRRLPSDRRAYPRAAKARSIVPTTCSVTPCSMPSRTLRAAKRWPKGAILDSICARCPWARAGRDEETVLRSNKETDQSGKENEHRQTPEKKCLTGNPIQGWAKRSVPTSPYQRGHGAKSAPLPTLRCCNDCTDRHLS
jgi:hypothetical protein